MNPITKAVNDLNSAVELATPSKRLEFIVIYGSSVWDALRSLRVVTDHLVERDARDGPAMVQEGARSGRGLESWVADANHRAGWPPRVQEESNGTD